MGCHMIESLLTWAALTYALGALAGLALCALGVVEPLNSYDQPYSWSRPDSDNVWGKRVWLWSALVVSAGMFASLRGWI